ncbi:hypothetical protein [Pseudoxanthomonas sp.]|jgi:hypothetical protein|uniref:hypothetical protein n=1 Tax=Pseudoxanthomonas sp. TaxID=1871049 RepID=UPI002E122EC0|nr:hypothetical protein [Pseudoxanthomonas sp.]
MATQKKFPVADFQVRARVPKQAQRNAFVRSATTSVLSTSKAKKRPDGAPAKKFIRKKKQAAVSTPKKDAKGATGELINCPFTADFHPLMNAMIFTVIACGFRPRAALEACATGEIRVGKIIKLGHTGLGAQTGIAAVERWTLNPRVSPDYPVIGNPMPRC